MDRPLSGSEAGSRGPCRAGRTRPAPGSHIAYRGGGTRCHRMATGNRTQEQHISDRDLLGTYLAEIGRVPLLTAEQEVELAKRIEAGLFAEQLLDSGRPEPKI